MDHTLPAIPEDCISQKYKRIQGEVEGSKVRTHRTSEGQESNCRFHSTPIPMDATIRKGGID